MQLHVITSQLTDAPDDLATFARRPLENFT